MAVYLTLLVAMDFTTASRCATFLFLIIFSSSYGDQLLEGTLFYTGALLAELSLLHSFSHTIASPRTSSHRFYFRVVRIKSYWPIILALFALFISSYPYNGAELMSYSRFLFRCGEIIFPSNCMANNGFSLILSRAYRLGMAIIRLSPSCRNTFLAYAALMVFA
jgi:hypothetical protein